MEKDKIHEELNKEGIIHISFSEFTQYTDCGHKHLIEKYLKIVEPPTSIHLIFGNAVHAAIEMGIKDKLSLVDRLIFFKEKFIKEMNDSLKESEDFKNLEAFTEQGEHILKILNTEKILEKYEIVGVEIPLYEKLYGPYFFKGFIDLIVKDKVTGKYLILDWKTSGEAWDVQKKKKNKVFMCQMRFYKYFFSRKFNINFDDIECKYIVLNRLKSKKIPDLGFGSIQPVEIYSTESEIEYSLKMLADVIKKIHIKNSFPKAKLTVGTSACFFCPYKKNLSLCNGDSEQYKELLIEHSTKIKRPILN